MQLRYRTSHLNSNLQYTGFSSNCCILSTRLVHSQHGLPAGDHLFEQGILSDKFSIVKALCACCKEKSLEKGKNLHHFAVSLGFDCNVTLATAVLSLYGKCGVLDDAFSIFYRLHDKDVVSWNAIISGAARHGCAAECIGLFNQMHQNCVLPDKFTTVSMLSACAALEDIKTGQNIHAQLVSKDSSYEVVVGTALIRMYCICKNIKYARRVFDEMEYRDEISWNTMISGYSELGYLENVFYVFNQMSCEGKLPNTVTFIVILDACAALHDVHLLHSWLEEVGLKLNVVLGSALVNAYCSFSCLHDAQKVFDSLSERNLITWNSLIAGYKAEKSSKKALMMFQTMQDGGINPDKITWSNVIDACADLESLGTGEWIYNQAVIVGLEDESVVVASAMKFYGMLQGFDIVQLLFRRVACKDFLLWNAVIMLNAQHGRLGEACEFLHEMLESGVVPDCQMLVDLLSACAKHAAFSEGRFVHSIAVFLSVDSDHLVAKTIIDMYGECSSFEDALCLFESMKNMSEMLLAGMIGAYANSGDSAHAMYLYAKMGKGEVLLDKATLLKLLNVCSTQEYMSDSQKMHIYVTLRGYDLDCVVANAVIKMYGNFGALVDAERVFEILLSKDAFSWNTMMIVYAQQDKIREIFRCLLQMELEGSAPNELTYVSILSGLTWKVSLGSMILIHGCILFEGFESVHAIVTPLIHFYSKVGMMEDAYCLFGKSHTWSVVAWNSIIKGFAEQGRGNEAFQLFIQMQNEGILAEKSSYICILDGFNDASQLHCGKHFHACLISLGFLQDIVLNTALISFYGRCCSVDNAWRVFNSMPEKDEICWSALQQALHVNYFFAETLQLFEKMQNEAAIPNSTCLLSLVCACTEYKTLRNGSLLHARLNNPHVLDRKIANAVLNMYGKAGSIGDAERNFIEMQERDVVSYNIMIKCYVDCHSYPKALQTFLHMVVEGILPDNVTLATALDVCGDLGAYFQGQIVHAAAVLNCNCYVTLQNAAISMYSKCGKLHQALAAFNHISEKNIASWNSVISAFCFWEVQLKAFGLFADMLSQVMPDISTFVIVISMCTAKGALTDGRLLHFLIASLGFENEVIIGNSLISMYGRCSCSSEAESVFESLSGKNTATWNAVATSGILEGAANLCLIDNMQRNRVCPNEITYICLLDFCADNNFSIIGRIIHMRIVLCGFEQDINVLTSLVNFYGKCGLLMDARSVFQSASSKTFFAWTAMITAYACCGIMEESLLLLQQMEYEELVVDNVTLVSVLSSCSYHGSLESGLCIFVEMLHEIMVGLEHFNCMVDLLSRLGQMTFAESIILSMPFQPITMSWTALVAACQTVGNADMALSAIAYITELNCESFS